MASFGSKKRTLTLGRGDMLEQVSNIPLIFTSHTMACGCSAELTDSSIFSFPEGIHVDIYPCTWHAAHWGIKEREKFPIEKWADKMAEQFKVDIVIRTDVDLLNPYFCTKTPERIAVNLDRVWRNTQSD